jgi:hypothetical protein
MEGVEEIKSAVPDAAGGNERSTVDFSYTDLDSAIDVVRGVHNAGGTACDSDQLAAQLNLESKGGGFRLKVAGAKSFGLITNERGGRVTLTDTGRQIIDPTLERMARMNAFLAVELYRKVFDQFKGGPLPPQAGLERALVSLGVGTGVKDRARQVMLRSAKQAGFFEASADRLVKPSIQTDATVLSEGADAQRREQLGRGGSGGGGGGGQEHPLIQGLLMTLPQPRSEWSGQERVNWLTMASSIFKMIYSESSPSDIEIKIKGGVAPAP